MEFKTKMCFTVSALILVTHASVQAMPPHHPNLVNSGNKWKVTAYVDENQNHAALNSYDICFFRVGDSGTHMRYTWSSTDYRDWNGRAVQEGDQIFMYGDFQAGRDRDTGHSAMEWEIVTKNHRNVGTGHMELWVEDGELGRPLGFANVYFKRVGSCQYHSVEEALEAGHNLELPVDDQGRYLYDPLGVLKEEVK
jgi:hypothetical protein